MSTRKELYTAVRSLILQSVDQSIFLSSNIKQGFQPPTGGDFISFLCTHSKKTSVIGYNVYDSDNNNKTNHILYVNHMQVDFYSDYEYNSSDASNIFHQYLTSNASEYLIDNYNSMSLGVIEEVVNNTDLGDKAKYLFRYTLRFEIFTHQDLTTAQVFIDEIVPKPRIIL